MEQHPPIRRIVEILIPITPHPRPTDATFARVKMAVGCGRGYVVREESLLWVVGKECVLCTEEDAREMSHALQMAMFAPTELSASPARTTSE